MKTWRQQWLGMAISFVISLLTAGRQRADAHRMNRLDFSTSTQRMGLRFTEKLRDHWRRRWLRIHR